jgi:hypothetical protein
MARPFKTIDPLSVARVIGQLGGTDEQLAEALGISRRALAYRKTKDSELFHTLKEAKDEADGRVQKALFQRAIGYTCNIHHISQHKGTVTVTPVKKHYPPDTTACIFWLKNRKPREWRDRTGLGTDQELAGVPNKVLENYRKRFRQRVTPHLSENVLFSPC